MRRVLARSNRIFVELSAQVGRGEPLCIAFEEQNGLLVAGIVTDGWLSKLTDEQKRVLRNALVGLYHHAGVALVREEIEARLGKPTPAYDISRQGLVVWPGPGYETELVIDLETGIAAGDAAPGPDGKPLRRAALASYSLRFDGSRVPWEGWVEAWEDDLDEDLEPREIGVGRILPEEQRLPRLPQA